MSNYSVMDMNFTLQKIADGRRCIPGKASRTRLTIIRVFFLVAVCLLMLGESGASASSSQSGKAARGVLDLSAWSFAEDGGARLKGDWEFYWERLLEPSDFAGGREPGMTGYISLPHSWNGYLVEGAPLSGQGYTTFRLTVALDAQAAKSELALKLPTIFHAYKLWIDDELAASVGEVGQARESTVPRLATKIVTFQPKSDNVQLLLQVANFHHMRGGVTKYIELNTADPIIRQSGLKLALDMCVTGSLIMIGVYHLFMFARRSKDGAPLYFGLLSIIWGLRSLLVGELVLTKAFPAFPWEIELKLEYLALFSGTCLFTMYIRSMFPQELPALVSRVSVSVCSAFGLLTAVAPARVYTHTLNAFFWIVVAHMIVVLIAMIMASARKRQGALLFCAACVIAFLTALNDFLYYGEKLPTGNLSPFGLLLFIFVQVFILSSRFSDSFRKVEQLSEALQDANGRLADWNENLEGVVAERTRQLSEAHDQLHQSYEELRRAEEARRKLLSYITHDLRSPIGIMIGYTEAIQDNVQPEMNDSYVKLIRSKAVRINRMLEDLYDLSQLESRRLSLDLRLVQAAPYMEEICERYEWEVSRSGLRLILEHPPSALHETVWMDSERIERVFANLIGNAQKFTSANGSITLSWWPSHNRRNIRFTVKDTGNGIHAEDLSRLFEGHYGRGTGRLNSREGSGLGLAICKEIVEMHGGSIWAESVEGEGSAFSFTLPTAKDDVPPARPKEDD